MYTREEKREMRLKFWDGFKGYSSRKRRRKRLPSKWAGDNTGIKQVNLKFHFDETEALVCIDIVADDLDKRIALFDKLESLKKILEDALGEALIWDLQYTIESGKEISRIYLKKENVSIYRQSCWPEVMVFFFNKMIRIEPLILEYRDYIKALGSGLRDY